MKLTLLLILLALLWAAMTGTFSGLNLLLGAAFGAVALFLLRGVIAPPRVLRKLGQVISLAGLFLHELVASAIRVSVVVLTPDLKSALHPAIIAFPLSVKSDLEITLLANLITLTPGTLSVDVSEDRAFLYVHALSIDTREALIADIAGGFEKRIAELYA